MAETPYLPDILGGVVSRVDAATFSKTVNPFHTYYEKGIYVQAGKDVSDMVYSGQSPFPLVWFVMPYVETFGRVGVFADVSFDIIIAMPTDPNWSQDEREQNTINPYLIPVYEQLMKEISKERWLVYDIKQPHKRIIRPFWGGADQQGGYVQNMFKQHIDAIHVKNITCAIRLCNPSLANYPISAVADSSSNQFALLFEQDMELVVDGGGENDPVSDLSSVSIASLAGKSYDIVQRGFGQFRLVNQPEMVIVDDGGFAFADDSMKFKTGDTFIIRFRPSFVLNTDIYEGTQKRILKSVFIEN